MSQSARWSSSKGAGFTVLELLVSAAILGILMTTTVAVTSTGLRNKSRQSVSLDLQQNLRVALQHVTQDLRSSALLHVWQTSSGCADLATPCSNDQEITVVGLNGTQTTLLEPPGNSFTNSSVTQVCDSSAFLKGDLALFYNVEQVQLIEITQDGLGKHEKPCSTGDKIHHNKDKLSGVYTSTALFFKAELINYSLQPDPAAANRTVLYRRTGMAPAAGNNSGIVAFGVSGLRFAYGVPTNPNNASDQLIFYNTLEAAATELRKLDPTYTADPRASGKYVGSVVRAVRVTATGTASTTLPRESTPRTLTLVETVDLRR